MPGKARPSICENILKEIYCWKCISETKRKAVIGLCERAIPQKVIPVDNELMFYCDGICPRCDEQLNSEICFNYCPECGQRLDWDVDMEEEGEL